MASTGDDPPPTENFRRITDELLLMRSEHNEGNLTTLDELALHQSHLTKIEYINRVCPKLRILLLQVRRFDYPFFQLSFIRREMRTGQQHRAHREPDPAARPRIPQP